MIGLIGESYIAGFELLNGIKSMYVNSVACIRLKGMRCFRVNSGVRQSCIMFP